MDETDSTPFFKRVIAKYKTLRREWREQIELSAKVNVALTLLIAVLTALNVFLVWKQANDSAQQTNDFLMATRNISRSAARAVIESKRATSLSVEQNKETLKTSAANAKAAMESSARQSKAALDASVSNARMALESSAQQSKASLEVTVSASQIDQRAYVWPSRFVPLEIRREINISPNFNIYFVNRGKSPAFLVSIEQYCVIGREAVALAKGTTVSFEGRMLKSVGGRAMPPGDPNENNTTTTQCNHRLTPDDMAASSIETAITGEIRTLKGPAILLYGRLTYKDIFGKTHTTDYCVLYNSPNPSTYTYCPHSNGMS